MTGIKRVGVIGAGTMGNGIAQVFAQAGFDVHLVDLAAPALDHAREMIETSLGKFVDKSKLSSAERDAALARLTTGTNVDALSASDFIVEAILEDPDAKRALFSRLDALTVARRALFLLQSPFAAAGRTGLGEYHVSADRAHGAGAFA